MESEIFETEANTLESETSTPQTETSIPDTEITTPQETISKETIPEESTPEPKPSPIIINGTEIELEVLRLINEARQQNGLCTLTWDPELYDTAKIRAVEASQSWSHTRPDGSHWKVLSPNLHGENLARKSYTAQQTFDAWMASQGHKDNILRNGFTRCAIYLYESEEGWFWCLHFGY